MYTKRFLKCLLFLALFTSLTACKSKEDKALALIDKQMFSSLYDYESYQPVETQIDSAFNCAEFNEGVITLAMIAADDFDEFNDENDEMQDALRSMRLWSDSYSSYGRSEFRDAKEEAEEHLQNIKDLAKSLAQEMTGIRAQIDSLDNQFCGWKVTHKFRCKTKGGNSTLGTYIYIFDKDVKNILYKEDTEDEDLMKAKVIINEIAEMPDESFAEFIQKFNFDE